MSGEAIIVLRVDSQEQVVALSVECVYVGGAGAGGRGMRGVLLPITNRYSVLYG